MFRLLFSAQDGSLGTRHMHALVAKRPCTKTGRLRVALLRAPFFLLGPATHSNWFYDGLSIITVISLGFQALLLSALVWPSYSITSLVATSRNPLALFGRAPPLRVRLPGGVGFPVFPIFIPVPAVVLT